MVEAKYETLRGVHRKGVAVEFSKRTGLHGAADGSMFIECDVLIEPKGMPSFRGGSRVWFAGVQFVACNFVMRGRVHDLKFNNCVHLLHCNWRGGPITEPIFGPGPYGQYRGDGSDSEVRCCDFMRADLRDARFYRTALNEVKLPGWPYLTVVACDGQAVYALPSTRRPALSRLVDEVADFAWEDKEMARAIDSLVFGVGLRDNEASIQVCHVDDVIKRGAASVERLRLALERFAHPAIRY